MKKGSHPFINCSTQGFRPFSSLVAKVDGIPIDRLVKQSTLLDKSPLIFSLWRKYIAENPDLAKVLRKASGLFDPFSTPGHLSAAEALWQIRSELLKKTASEIVIPEPEIEPTEEILSESKISDPDKGNTIFPGLKLKEISVMVSSKKAMNFNSIAFSYAVIAEAEQGTDFLAAIEHIKVQLLTKIERDHLDFSSISISKSSRPNSNSKSSLGLGHIN